MKAVQTANHGVGKTTKAGPFVFPNDSKYIQGLTDYARFSSFQGGRPS